MTPLSTKLTFSDEQASLLEVATTFCREKISIATVRRQVASESGFDRELWNEIAAWKAFDIGFDVLPRLVGRIHAIELAGAIGSYHRDIGTHESLALAEADAPRVFGQRPRRPGFRSCRFRCSRAPRR